MAKEFYLTPAADANLSALPPDSPDNKVDVPCLAYREMERYWEVIDTVKSGTLGLQDKGKIYLPIEPFESTQAYERRLKKCNFESWYERITGGLVGMVLRKPLVFNNISEKFKEHLKDVDLQGNDVNVFVRQVFESAIDRGHSGILVDYPKVEGITTLAEQVELDVRPYWVHIKAEDILGGRFATINSRPTLTQLRLRCDAVVPSGEFGEAVVKQVKVYDLVVADEFKRCRYRVFQELRSESGEKGYYVVDEGLISLPYIPFYLVHTKKIDNLKSKPPMLEIAHMNLKHYQLSSDLDHSLHIAANPKLALFGYDTTQGDITMGVDEALVFTDPQSRAEWIAPPTNAFEPLRDRIKEIESKMQILGLSTLVGQKNVAESAEAKKLDRVQGDSQMAVAAQGLQDCIDNCLQAHADYLDPGNLPQPAPECQVNRDFDLSKLTAQDVQVFSQLQQLGQISLETFLELLKKGEVLPDEFNTQEELRKIAQGGVADEVLAE